MPLLFSLQIGRLQRIIVFSFNWISYNWRLTVVNTFDRLGGCMTVCKVNPVEIFSKNLILSRCCPCDRGNVSCITLLKVSVNNLYASLNCLGFTGEPFIVIFVGKTLPLIQEE